MKLPPPNFKENWRFYGKYIGLGLIFASGMYYAWNSEANSKTFWMGVIISVISVLLFGYFQNKESYRNYLYSEK